MTVTGPYVVLAGSIATGGTRLTKAVAEEVGLRAVLEPQGENPWLREFYESGMERHALESQMFFLAAQLRQHADVIDRDEQAIIQDRSIHETVQVFAGELMDRGSLAPEAHQIISDIYWAVKDKLRRPDLLVLLDAPAEVTLQRIRARGRPGEQGITLEYLQRLRSRELSMWDGWIGARRRIDVQASDPEDPQVAVDLAGRIAEWVGLA